MKNLLFFLWMMFFPLVEDVALWVVWKTKGKPQPDNYYGTSDWLATGALYVIVAWLLYQSN